MHLPFHHDQLKIIEKCVSFRSAFVPRTDFVDEFALSSNEQIGFELSDAHYRMLTLYLLAEPRKCQLNPFYFSAPAYRRLGRTVKVSASGSARTPAI